MRIVENDVDSVLNELLKDVRFDYLSIGGRRRRIRVQLWVTIHHFVWCVRMPGGRLFLSFLFFENGFYAALS